MGMNCYIYHTRASLYTQSYVQETIQICTELSGNRRDTTILTSGNTQQDYNCEVLEKIMIVDVLEKILIEKCKQRLGLWSVRKDYYDGGSVRKDYDWKILEKIMIVKVLEKIMIVKC